MGRKTIGFMPHAGEICAGKANMIIVRVLRGRLVRNAARVRTWGMSSSRTDFYATGLVIKKGVEDRKRLGV
jgi:hypothetical protein